MAKRQAVILSVTLEGLTQAEAARRFEVSESYVSRLMARFRVDGDAAFEVHSRRPRSSPTATPDKTVELIVDLRVKLIGKGLDAGPVTIVWHLAQHHGIKVGRDRPAASARRRAHRGRAQEAAPHLLRALRGRAPQQQLDTFTDEYNNRRPHRSLGRATPTAAYLRLPKASPAGSDAGAHHRVRHDRVDTSGVVTLRHNGRLHHIGIGPLASWTGHPARIGGQASVVVPASQGSTEGFVTRGRRRMVA